MTFFTTEYLVVPLVLLLGYPILCSSLRFRRLRNTLRKYPYTTRASFAKMTDDDATAIQRVLTEYEFPMIYEKALQFALFRTYGIPLVSKLSVETGQLCNSATAAKRYTDTTVLIAEFMEHPPTSERSREGIARMNYIHSHYQKSGKIDNASMLYTLALFAVEPVKWIARYEWRHLEDFEICAMGTFWKSVGDAMGLDMGELPSGLGGSQGTWKDGLEWWEEMKEWSEAYEDREMTYLETNHRLAVETTNLLLWTVPGFAKNIAWNVVSTLMDAKLRTAIA
jgi:hypothetical protein